MEGVHQWKALIVFDAKDKRAKSLVCTSRLLVVLTSSQNTVLGVPDN